MLVKSSAKEEAQLKEEERYKEQLDALEKALKEKTDQLIQHLNQEKVRNARREGHHQSDRSCQVFNDIDFDYF